MQFCTRYILNASTPAGADANKTEWSANGEKSISPFCPCAETRIPHVFHASRLGKDDVLWDLGCGDGRILLEAAARYRIKCVGVEVDEKCLELCQQNAKEWGPDVEKLVTWVKADMTTLDDDYFLKPTAKRADICNFPDAFKHSNIFLDDEDTYPVASPLHIAVQRYERRNFVSTLTDQFAPDVIC